VGSPGRFVRWCDRWNAAHPWDHNAHHHRWLLRRLPRRLDRALDVGSGTGDLVRLLRARARRVDGVDLDARTVAEARRLLGPDPAVTLVHGDVLTLDLAGGYDAVTALAVVHHLPLEPALTRLRDLLAPGGTLVVLGVYREETPTDRLLGGAAVPTNLVMGALHGRHGRPRSMTAPTAPATTTLAEIRSVAARVLPGATIRRHLFWRYSLVHRAPALTEP
jgi:SAM-dependent methyltransferase